MLMPWRRRREHTCRHEEAHRAAQRQANAYRADLGRTTIDLATAQSTITDLRGRLDKAAGAEQASDRLTQELAAARREISRLRDQLDEAVGYGALRPATWSGIKSATLLQRVRDAERRAGEATQAAALARKRGDRLEELLAAAESRPVQKLPDEATQPAPASA